MGFINVLEAFAYCIGAFCGLYFVVTLIARINVGYYSVSIKLTVTVTEMSNNWNILNQLTVTVTVTEIKLVTEM